MQKKIGKKENGQKENKKERIEDRICFLPLYLVRKKSKKKENRRESIFSCLFEQKNEKK